MNILQHGKDTEKLDKIYSELSGTTQEKVMAILMQVAVYQTDEYNKKRQNKHHKFNLT